RVCASPHALRGAALGRGDTAPLITRGPYLPGAFWARAGARNDTWSHDADYVAVLIAAEIAALVLGFLVELPVSIAMALFG
ncbi:hypothetical protein ACFWZS_16215, partial [[Kitasatospora] papulosa]